MRRSTLILILCLQTFPALGEDSTLAHTQINNGVDVYAAQLRQSAMRGQIAAQMYSSPGISQYSAQIYDQGQRINKLTSYFGPQGIDVFNSAQLDGAIQRDLAARDLQARGIERDLSNRIGDVMDRFSNVQKSLVKENGQLATQDKQTIREGESRIRQLDQQLAVIENYADTAFRDQHKSIVGAPYLDKDLITRNVAASDQVANQMINGSANGYKGTVGLRGYLNQSANQFGTVAVQIEHAEDEMRNAMIQNYVVGGIQIAVGATLTATGGGGLPILASGISTVGMTARNNVVLNNRGLEGFQSSSEKNAALGFSAFQMALSAAEMTSGIRSTASQASRMTNATLLERAYIAHRYGQVAKGVADMTGVTTDLFGEKGATVLDTSMAAADLLFLAKGVSKSVAIKSDAGLRGLSSSEATKDAARILVTDHPLTVATQILADARSISLGTGFEDELFKRNDMAIRIGMESTKLVRLLTQNNFSRTIDRLAVESISDPVGAFRNQVLARTDDPNGRSVSEAEARIDFNRIKSGYFDGLMQSNYPSKTEPYTLEDNSKGLARIAFSVNDPKVVQALDNKAVLSTLTYLFRPDSRAGANFGPEPAFTKTILVRAPSESALSSVKNSISAKTDFQNDIRFKSFDITTIERLSAGGAKIFYQGANGIKDGYIYTPGNDTSFLEFLKRHEINLNDFGGVR